MAARMLERDRWNGARWDRSDRRGHYESWFQRANHPSRPLAFWIRYTLFAPRANGTALGELWAVVFDGESGRVVAVKEEHPIERCELDPCALGVTIAGARLEDGSLEGGAACGGHTIGWSLRYASPSPPLLLLDPKLYGASFPKAKALVGAPLARFTGHLDVDGERWPVEDWVGSQNHNWGSKHTDRYAWGQVAGFDEDPDAFLEVATAQVKVGPLWTPRTTLLCLRLDGEEHRFDSIGDALRRTRGRYAPFEWTFSAARGDLRIEGRVEAPREAFVALPYPNPPGGTKICLNSKIARCALTVSRGGGRRTLTSAHRAAFEILTDRAPAGVPLLDPHA